MTGAKTLSWFAGHELRLAWRDWAAMMAGGRTSRERAITAGAIVTILCLHLLSYAIIKPFLGTGLVANKALYVMLTGSIAFTFCMVLSQAIEQVTRAFYARADLDLILSSPASASHLFAVRIAAVAFSGALMTSLLVAPAINCAALIDGVHWLSAYAAILALSAIATGLSVIAAVALFKSFGPKRARLAAQIFAAITGASLLIAVQVIAVLYYGNISRFEVFRSPAVLNAAPDLDSLFWMPVRALLGDAKAMLSLLTLSLAFLTVVIMHYAPGFATHAVAALSDGETSSARRKHDIKFERRSVKQALRAKEWMLLKRDPWLLSQTLMQILYLIPAAIYYWKNFGSGTGSAVIIAPVLTMAFGQLAGGLAWLAISGEDAADLVATAPVRRGAVLRAKIESVLAVIAVAAAPMILALSFSSLSGAAAAALGVMFASSAAITIQMWFKVAATRSQFRRRQTASRAATFAEAFSSVFWAGAAGAAASGSYWTIALVILAVATLGIARLIRPAATAG